MPRMAGVNGRRAELGAAWRGLWGGERILLFFAALATLVAVLVRPIVVLTSDDARSALSRPRVAWPHPSGVPHLAGSADGVVHPDLVDPWGRPWRFVRAQQHFYERGERITFRLLAAGADRPTFDGHASWEVPLLLATRRDGLVVTVLLLWLWATVRGWRAPRSANLALETWRVTVAASGLVVLGVLFALSRARELSGLEVLAPRQLLVSPPVAVAGTVGLLLWFAVLGVRLRRPVEPLEEPISWRRPAVVAGALAALAALVLVSEWRDAVGARRRDLLAGASVGVPDAVSELIATGDDDLLRAFARRDSPWVDVGLLTEAERAALASVGPEAAPLLARRR